MITGYLMESDGEAARLAGKVDATDWAERYLLPAARQGLILEVGSGPMHLLDAVTRLTGRRGVGVDVSERRLRAHASTCKPAPGISPMPVCADVASLPFLPNMFAMSYARFTLEHLGDPEHAVIEMARVTKAGGIVLLQDLDGQFVTHHPVDPPLQRAIEAVIARTAGRFDPYVGRKLYGYARRAGLVDITVTVEPYHLIAGTADPLTLTRWDEKLSILMPLAATLFGEEAAQDLIQRLHEYLADPDTLTFSMLFTVSGRVPDPGIDHCVKATIAAPQGQPGETADSLSDCSHQWEGASNP